jgi:hypothetical protein
VPVSLVANRKDRKTDHFAEDSKNYARIIFLHHLKIDVAWLLAIWILFLFIYIYNIYTYICIYTYIRMVFFLWSKSQTPN